MRIKLYKTENTDMNWRIGKNGFYNRPASWYYVCDYFRRNDKKAFKYWELYIDDYWFQYTSHSDKRPRVVTDGNENLHDGGYFTNQLRVHKTLKAVVRYLYRLNLPVGTTGIIKGIIVGEEIGFKVTK